MCVLWSTQITIDRAMYKQLLFFSTPTAQVVQHHTTTFATIGSVWSLSRAMVDPWPLPWPFFITSNVELRRVTAWWSPSALSSNRLLHNALLSKNRIMLLLVYGKSTAHEVRRIMFQSQQTNSFHFSTIDSIETSGKRIKIWLVVIKRRGVLDLALHRLILLDFKKKLLSARVRKVAAWMGFGVLS